MNDKDKAEWKRVLTIMPMILIAAFWATVGLSAVTNSLSTDGIAVMGMCTIGFMICMVLMMAYEMRKESECNKVKWVECSKCMGTGKVLAESQLMKEERKSV